MEKYLINNNGCDDTTAFEIELTNEELKIILKFIKLNNANSSYGCQPKIDIYKDYFYQDSKPRRTIFDNGDSLTATSLLKDSDVK